MGIAEQTHDAVLQLTGKVGQVQGKIDAYEGRFDRLEDALQGHSANCPVRKESSVLLSLPARLDNLENVREINGKGPTSSDWSGFRRVAFWALGGGSGAAVVYTLIETIRGLLEK